MSNKNALFFKVLELLKEKGLTQTQLAQKAGLSQPSLSKILSGRYKTKNETIKKLAKALEVPTSYLADNRGQIVSTGGSVDNGNENTDKDILLQLKDHEIRLLKIENELLKKLS